MKCPQDIRDLFSVCCHGFCVNCIQIVNDDIEAIEETLPKLEAFYTSHGGISASVDGLHDQLDKFSTSAISSEGVESKNKALQVCVNEVHSDWSGICVHCTYNKELIYSVRISPVPSYIGSMLYILT